MKNYLYLVALAGMIFTGCVKTDVATPEQKDIVIGFQSPVMYSNMDTKAGHYGEIGDNTYPTSESFTIFAVSHTGDLVSWSNADACEFNNTAVSYNGTFDAWVPMNGSSYYYWPNGKKLSFAAYSPSDLELTGVTPAYSNQGLTIADFTIQADPAKQYDLLFSKRAVNKTVDNMQYNDDYYNGIPIEFKHALSSVRFTFAKDAGVVDDVVLNKLELKNAKYKGTFNENITNETSYASNPKWTVSSAEKASYIPFNGTKATTLLLLPQDLANDLVLEVTYTVTDTDDNSSQYTKTLQLNKYPLGTSPVTKWVLGTRYTYNIIYGAASQQKDIIMFSPATEGWIDADEIEIVL